MLIDRRGFTGGALSLALGSLAAPVFAQDSRYASALAAIRSYGEAHLQHFRLPGMTLGVTMADGFSTVLNFGLADLQGRTPITSETLFQVGSISKLMTAAVIHQLVAEGRLRLTDRVSDLLPDLPLPAGNTIQIQHLLDHVAGIASDVPLSADGGLWTAFAPGQHWHYSNTGYEILGRLIEQISGKPLARVLHDRIFAPLGMTRTRGAVVGEDRMRYAQGYEAADQLPFATGVPLAPAAWVDVTSGAASVASTAEDMNRLLRSVAGAAQGRGGLGLAPQAARAWATHTVASDERAIGYGNGLMHIGSGGRTYLHHTGGMVSFSSSFHLDIGSGAGAFASATIGAFAGYRPRSLTMFAIDALTNAAGGRALPAPPSLDLRLANPAAYAGSYSGPAGSFEVRPGNPLTIVSAGQSAPLQYWGGEIFRTAHPAFRAFSFLFERSGGTVTAANWGADVYTKAGSGRSPAAVRDEHLAKLSGRYVNDSPWLGIYEVVERGGRLWFGTEVPMSRIGDNLWRVGRESWSPERASFANFIGGRPQTFIYSGDKFSRHDI
jgi:CubicO group peptidase (beta-lactamase class C family)